MHEAALSLTLRAQVNGHALPYAHTVWATAAGSCAARRTGRLTRRSEPKSWLEQ